MLYFLLILLIGCSSERIIKPKVELRNYQVLYDPKYPKVGEPLTLNVYSKDERGLNNLVKEIEFLITAPGLKEVKIEGNTFIPSKEGEYNIRIRYTLEKAIYPAESVKIYPKDGYKKRKSSKIPGKDTKKDKKQKLPNVEDFYLSLIDPSIFNENAAGNKEDSSLDLSNEIIGLDKKSSIGEEDISEEQLNDSKNREGSLEVENSIDGSSTIALDDHSNEAGAEDLVSEKEADLNNIAANAKVNHIIEDYSEFNNFVKDSEERNKFLSSAFKGRNIIKNILEDNMLEEENPKESIQHITNYLFVKACGKNQGFHEGTYVVVDSEEKIFNYFMKLKDKIGYSRISSHAATRSNTSEHYGIDLELGEILPAGKKHLLFFQLKLLEGKKGLFLKPENFGVKELKDIVNHGIEYVESFLKRFMGLAHDNHDEIHRKERPQYNQDVEKALMELFEHYIQTHHRVVINIEEDLNMSFMEVPNEDKIKKNMKEYGFSFIVWFLDQMKQNNDVVKDEKFESLYQKILSLDNVDIRTAREVVFRPSELIN